MLYSPIIIMWADSQVNDELFLTKYVHSYYIAQYRYMIILVPFGGLYHRK